jgi:hypothetical protein
MTKERPGLLQEAQKIIKIAIDKPPSSHWIELAGNGANLRYNLMRWFMEGLRVRTFMEEPEMRVNWSGDYHEI